MADLPPRITTLDGQTVQTPHVVMYKGSSPKQLANFNSTNGCYHVIDTVLAPKANVAPPPPPPQPSFARAVLAPEANVAPPPPPPQPSPAEVAAAFRGQKFQATGASGPPSAPASAPAPAPAASNGGYTPLGASSGNASSAPTTASHSGYVPLGATPNNGSGGASDNGGDSARVAALERELAQVKAELADARAQLERANLEAQVSRSQPVNGAPKVNRSHGESFYSW